MDRQTEKQSDSTTPERQSDFRQSCFRQSDSTTPADSDSTTPVTPG